MKYSAYTLGCSGLTVARFLAILNLYDIKVVADIRRHPYDAGGPGFARDELALKLKWAGIDYLFLGNALGAGKSLCK